jgi:hypothetical protein
MEDRRRFQQDEGFMIGGCKIIFNEEDQEYISDNTVYHYTMTRCI